MNNTTDKIQRDGYNDLDHWTGKMEAMPHR
jgi:hypothetical protein